MEQVKKCRNCKRFKERTGICRKLKDYVLEDDSCHEFLDRYDSNGKFEMEAEHL